MLNFKFKLVVIIFSIFWLSNQECFCNQSGEIADTLTGNETLLASEAAEDEQQIEMTTERNISRNYHVGISLASWRWNEIGVYYTVSLFIIITGLSKVAFHHAEWLSSRVPESCLLISVGFVVGSIIFTLVQARDAVGVLPSFTPRLFFLVLLPPVILESAYSLYNATFFDNLPTILLFAVVGTIFNTFSIGFLLNVLHNNSWMGDWYSGNTPGEEVVFSDITLSELLIFSALISAVDPVAVLAIFQEVGVNKDLYFLIFGESLLNDAITVVLYHTMVAMASKPTIDSMDYTMAVLSFFTVNLGGMTVGVFFGLFTAVITKTTSEVRVVEPLAVLGMAYLSYLTAELFHFSGIISIIFCGLLQAHYSFKNISSKSYVTVKYFTKMVSATSEAVIFLFLGTVLFSYKHDLASGFIYWSILLCLICRFIGVFVLTAISNMFRMKRIQLQEQFIMAYGGLRGAVGFSLVIMLNDEETKARSVYVTTTLAVILFTVFIQGATIKPLVKVLNIEISKARHKTLIGEINNQVASHLMAGIEEIIGFKGNYYFKRKFLDIDEKYLHKIFLRDKSENRIRHVFEKTSLNHHYAHLYGPITLVEDNKIQILHDNPIPKDTRLSYIPFVADESSHSKRARNAQSELFSGVELRKKDPSEVKPGLLMKAFQSSPFQKYFQRYNPNLIEDDKQELYEQLALRHKRAKRITIAAYNPYQDSGKSDLQPILSDNSDESVASIRRNVRPGKNHPSSLEYYSLPQHTYEEAIGFENIIKRAERRRTIGHTGVYTADMGTVKRMTDSNSGMEMTPKNELPGHSFENERPQSTESKAGFSSANMNAPPPLSESSNERDMILQEKLLLLDSDKTDDSEDESPV
ncbi:probable Na(+)/H(+) antiporter nhx-9 [Hetaerina americana]|uniref:probable Na(+)/H(+) antiporter nhx-9 n=1 Tax=Hetaerina americana TaxID=62018 RepID=UPI003A7F19F1